MITQKAKLSVQGMTCSHCEMVIEKGLLSLKGVTNVEASFGKEEVAITYNAEDISLEEIKNAINKLNYKVLGDYSKKHFIGNTNAIYILIIIMGAYVILSHFELLNFTNYFPKVQSSMGYATLFIVGLLTSLHCVAMCGGINIAQSVHSVDNNKSAIQPNLLYNLGRVVSYTVIGGIVGGIGSVFTLTGSFRGIVAILAGIFMIIMGLNMLNIFPWLRNINIKVPKFISKIVFDNKLKSKSSFYIGLLNGLMPCGPLQSMQLYALSTGSIITGAFSMFAFSIGTVPLMFGVGTVSSKLNKRFTERMLSISALLVIVLGVGMMNNGLGLSGVVVPQFNTIEESPNTAKINGDYQTITTSLDYGTYPAITVKAGIPVQWTLIAERGRVNGCNDVIIIDEYDLKIPLYEGENLIEFTPTESGQFGYSCWMGMIRSSITVVE